MTDLTDINSYIQQVISIEKGISSAFDQLPGTEGPQRRGVLLEISEKIRRAKDYVSSIQMELFDIDDESTQEEYRAKYEEHNRIVTQYEEQLRNAESRAQNEEKARGQGATTKDLMGKSLELQNQQKTSLDNSLRTIEEAKQVGGDTLVEIGRQKEVLEKTSQELNEMDSELYRAKKIMKVMITRAAGDKCVRILALLVLLAVIAIIVVEIISPGAVKKQAEGWFSISTSNTTTT
ncbi:putative plant SNARE 11 [Histomonas meleagridis]|uniref:putative plant SNARE 11 n=1 Tax=Histomonas meleagridis TaxID=135588 RepID=UPI00355985A1|nr:putative plant SNARE 11 [Histomonas meleagridis]KAH0803606.1 putative plant SNARE 11 [Histomonas meleagridis]